MIHDKESELAGKTVKIKSSVKHFQFKDFGGSDFIVKDWWDRISGESWKYCAGNPTALVYATRAALNKLPIDDNVLYGKVGHLGHLVHITEIAKF